MQVYAVFRTKQIRLTHFQPMFRFYTPWKYLKTYDFLFSGGIEVEHELNMD